MNLSEYDVIQNKALGAIILHAFVLEYYNQKERLEGPELPFIMPVLPIVFNKKILRGIYSRNKKGGFFKAIYNHFDLPAGLQKKMQAMSDKTFDSLNIAFSYELLTYEVDSSQLIPVRKTLLTTIVTGNNRDQLYGATRLGYWFANTSPYQIFKHLNLKF